MNLLMILKRKELNLLILALQPNLKDVVSESPFLDSALMLPEFLILIKKKV